MKIFQKSTKSSSKFEGNSYTVQQEDLGDFPDVLTVRQIPELINTLSVLLLGGAKGYCLRSIRNYRNFSFLKVWMLFFCVQRKA